MVTIDKNTDLQAQGETEVLNRPRSVRAEGFETLTALINYSNVMPNILYRRKQFYISKGFS